jgi:hypothetical protein
MLRTVVLRAIRRAADRLIGASVVFALCGGAYLAMGHGTNLGAVAMIALGAAGAIGGAVMRARGPGRPIVRALLEHPERVARVTLAPSGHPGAIRVIFADGGELNLALSERDARTFAAGVGVFCTRAEIALPWLQRAARG